MSKFDKFRDILAIGSAVAKPFVPGGVSSVLDAVNGQLSKGGASTASADSIKQLATDNDEQTKAILALHARNEAQQVEINAIKAKLGL